MKGLNGNIQFSRLHAPGLVSLEHSPLPSKRLLNQLFPAYDQLCEKPIEPSVTDRDPRSIVSMKAQLARANGDVLDIRVIDLSSNGCKILTPTFLWVGDKVGLSVPGYASLNGVVRWSREGHAGVEFEESEASQRTEIPRATERIPVGSVITLRRLGGPNFGVTLYDLSLAGCRVEVIERPRVGETLHLRLAGLATIEAKVRWVDGFVAGLTFATPFHPAIFEMLVDRLGRLKR